MVSPEFLVAHLAAEALEENVALARAVGWPDGESDWRVLYDSALVLGVRHDGALVGQGALGLYGKVGSIAKMIVRPDFQRLHIGARLLDALLDEASRRSIGVLGLVATPVGRPLYEQRHFRPVGEVAVLAGTPQVAGAVTATPPLPNAALAVQLEERWMSCTRSNMLRGRLRESIASASLPGEGDQVRGYALATPQGTLAMIGPVIAETEADARTLVSALCRSGSPVRIDVPVEQRGFRDWLKQLGLQEQDVRVEMAKGATRLPWQVPQRFALAAPAWG